MCASGYRNHDSLCSSFSRPLTRYTIKRYVCNLTSVHYFFHPHSKDFILFSALFVKDAKQEFQF